jgi:integrase/recombinase XerD
MENSELESYLKKRLAPGTVKRYLREVELFFNSAENNGIDPEKANYQNIMNYLGQLREQKKGSPINCSLHALQKYYTFLVVNKKRKDHPCRYIRLRDKRSRDIQLQDLFSSEELELLLERKKERYQILKNRNKIIISFLIYQGLANGEIKNIALQDISFETGTIKLKDSRKINGRVLKLQSKQLFWLLNYLEKDRPKLLKVESEKLLISSRGTAESGEGIGYILECLRYLFPERKLNAKTIRQSVITNLLSEGKDLRIVQAFAGHKYPSTTERYKQTQVEELKDQILKYHPLQ